MLIIFIREVNKGQKSGTELLVIDSHYFSLMWF